MESVLSLVLLGHDGGEAGESRAWEISVIWRGLRELGSGIQCPLFGVGGA